MANKFFNNLLGLSSGFAPPLDAYSTTDAAWGGTFKLRTAYAGSCVRAKISGGAELDIGFDSTGWVDMAAYAAFGSGTEKIITIYDQTGNGFDMTQSDLAKCGILQLNPQNSKPEIYNTALGVYENAGFTNYRSKVDVNFISAVRLSDNTQILWQNGDGSFNVAAYADATGNFDFQDWITQYNRFGHQYSVANTVYGFKYEGNAGTFALKARAFRNGVEQTPSSTTDHQATWINFMTGLQVANCFTSGTCGLQMFGYFGYDLSAADHTTIATSLNAITNAHTDYQIQFIGDSLTYSNPWSDNVKWGKPLTLALEALTGKDWDAVTAGNTATQIGADIAACQALATPYGSVCQKIDVNRLETVVCVWAGTNNLADGDSAATAHAEAVTLVNLLVGRGATVFYLNAIARKREIGNGVADQATLNANIASFNSGLAAQLGATATVIDVASQPELSDYDDATYYNGDGIHLTQAGYDVVKDTAYAAIVSALNL